MENFKKLHIPDYILKVIEQDKFEKPSEIQEKAIPLVLAGKDVIAESATGSGKTLAFGAGVIKDCEKQGVIQALVLVPTRELANQVSETLEHFSENKPLEITEIYGGVAISPQVQKLKYADVVVGTPGRILDHIERRTIELGYVKILVLDEADRMLDMGFIRDVEKIMSYCKTRKQTLLFSATISTDIIRISKKFMNDPISISAEPQVDPSKLKQYYYDVPDNQKFAFLVYLLKEEHEGLVMVFCNTQRNTDFIAKNLYSQGIDAEAIHGGLSQDKRSRIMSSFKSDKAFVLVCTDVAARGLDIKGVSHIYNYDIPNDPIQYVHRIGRTARAGKDGKAINILASRDYENFSALKRRSDFDIEKKELPDEIPWVDIQFKGGSRFSDRRNSFRSGSRFGGNRGGSSRFSGKRNFGVRSEHGNRGERSQESNGGGYGMRSEMGYGGGEGKFSRGGRRFGGSRGGSRFGSNSRGNRDGGRGRFGDRENSPSDRRSFRSRGRSYR